MILFATSGLKSEVNNPKLFAAWLTLFRHASFMLCISLLICSRKEKYSRIGGTASVLPPFKILSTALQVASHPGFGSLTPTNLPNPIQAEFHNQQYMKNGCRITPKGPTLIHLFHIVLSFGKHL